MASQGASDVQSLTQKAETFWSEIKDLKIPDVTSGKKKGKIYNLGKIFRQDTSIDQTEKLIGSQKRNKSPLTILRQVPNQ